MIELGPEPKLPGRGIGSLAHWLVAIAVVAALSAALFGAYGLAGRAGLSASAAAAHAAPVKRIESINRRMESLEGQFNVLLAESVERRLGDLQRSISSGHVDSDTIRAYEQLKNDLKLLQAAEVQGQTLEPEQLEHQRFRSLTNAVPAPGQGNADSILENLLELKALLYLILLFFSASSLAAGGYWLEHRRRARRLVPVAPALALLPRKSAPPAD